MLKNTVMSLPDKFIVFLGRTFSGHNHDYTMLKQEFPPEVDWFKDIHVRVDLGYQGMQSDSHLDQLDIPHKKPRKSKKNPHPELSAVQKAVNKALSQVRIFVEHAIGGMKRYNILVHGFRNRKENFEDDVIGVCAGLWNLILEFGHTNAHINDGFIHQELRTTHRTAIRIRDGRWPKRCIAVFSSLRHFFLSTHIVPYASS